MITVFVIALHHDYITKKGFEYLDSTICVEECPQDPLRDARLQVRYNYNSIAFAQRNKDG